jgi:hypothetical protein
LETWVMWSLAVVVPGGLVILAVWLSVRAARRQALLGAAVRPRISRTPGVLQG